MAMCHADRYECWAAVLLFTLVWVSVYLHDHEPMYHRDGRPCLRFEGQTKQDVAAEGIDGAHVSLSHDTDYAMAYVMLTTTPTENVAEV